MGGGEAKFISNVLNVLSLSGILATQVFMYFRLYPKDLTKHKIIVALIWYVCILKSE